MPDPRPLVWSCAALTGGMLLHVDRVPLWASATALALVAWRLLAHARAGADRRSSRAPALALLLTALVFTRFHTLNGLAAGTTLLVLMAALKLLETRTTRDQLVMVGCGAVPLAGGMPRPPESGAGAAVPAAGVAVLCRAHRGHVRVGLRRARRSPSQAARCLLAAPLAALLFLFFPRLPGAFWTVPRGEEALTGLSDTMSPGGITHLSSSYDTAFRARFARHATASHRSATGAVRCCMTSTATPGAVAQLLRHHASRLRRAGKIYHYSIDARAVAAPLVVRTRHSRTVTRREGAADVRP